MFFNRLAFVFASGAINETSSPPVLRVYYKAKYSAFKRAQEERMKESVGNIARPSDDFFARTKFTRSSWIAHFAVDILLLHHYKSDLAHLSDFDSLVNELSKSKI